MRETTEKLFAIHNTSALNLAKTLDLGGFPCPSIAITKESIGHTSYGDISVIFPMETVDPINLDNRVYSRDAWTPITPIVQCQVDRDKLSALKNDCRQHLDQTLFSHFGEEWTRFEADFIEGFVENMTGLESLFAENIFMQGLYIQTHGGIMPELHHEVIVEKSETSADAQELLDVLSKEEVQEYDRLTSVGNSDELTDKDQKTLKEIRTKAMESTGKRWSPFKFSILIHSAATAGESEEKNVWNDKEFIHKLHDATNTPDYTMWLSEQCKSIVKRWGICNDRPQFKPDGTARPWEYTHDPLTLKSMTRSICSASEKGSVNSLSAFHFLYAAANELYSMQDIISASEHLEALTDQTEADENRQYVTKMAEGIADSIRKDHRRGPITDTATSVVVETAMAESRADMEYVLNANRQYINVQSDTVDRIWALKEYVNSMPTRYLEAKPHRAVGLNEIGIVMLPDDQKELKMRLENLGINTLEYDHNHPEMRTEMLKFVHSLGMTLPEKQNKQENLQKKNKRKGRSM